MLNSSIQSVLLSIYQTQQSLAVLCLYSMPSAAFLQNQVWWARSGQMWYSVLFSFSCRHLFVQNKNRCRFFFLTDCAKSGNVDFNSDLWSVCFFYFLFSLLIHHFNDLKSWLCFQEQINPVLAGPGCCLPSPCGRALGRPAARWGRSAAPSPQRCLFCLLSSFTLFRCVIDIMTIQNLTAQRQCAGNNFCCAWEACTEWCHRRNVCFRFYGMLN